MHASRRDFLRAAAVAPLFAARSSAAAALQQGADDPWTRASAILQRIVPPRFPARDFDITTFGAVGDGRADCTDAIRKAIAACRSAGGGRIVVPAGRFL